MTTVYDPATGTWYDDRNGTLGPVSGPEPRSAAPEGPSPLTFGYRMPADLAPPVVGGGIASLPAGQPASQPGVPQAPMTATNPDTGERFRLIGGEWVPDRVTGADYRHAAMAGLGGLVEGAGSVAGWLGAGDTKKSLQDWGRQTKQDAEQAMSPAAREAAQKDFVVEDPNSLLGYGFGPGWNLPTIGLQAAQSIAPTVGGMAAGLAATAALPEVALTGLGGAAAGLAARLGLSRIAAMGATELGAKTLGASIAGAVINGSSEGLVAAGMGAADVEQFVLNADKKYLELNPVYQKVLKETGDEDAARKATATALANDAALRTGFTTSVLGAPAGGFYGKLVHGVSGRGLLGAIGGGIAEEAAQEVPQSALEEYWQNLSKGQVDPSITPGKNVLNAAVGGGVVGGFMGGLTGAGGHAIGRLRGQGAAEDAPAEETGTPAAEGGIASLLALPSPAMVSATSDGSGAASGVPVDRESRLRAKEISKVAGELGKLRQKAETATDPAERDAAVAEWKGKQAEYTELLRQHQAAMQQPPRADVLEAVDPGYAPGAMDLRAGEPVAPTGPAVAPMEEQPAPFAEAPARSAPGLTVGEGFVTGDAPELRTLRDLHKRAAAAAADLDKIRGRLEGETDPAKRTKLVDQWKAKNEALATLIQQRDALLPAQGARAEQGPPMPFGPPAPTDARTPFRFGPSAPEEEPLPFYGYLADWARQNGGATVSGLRDVGLSHAQAVAAMKRLRADGVVDNTGAAIPPAAASQPASQTAGEPAAQPTTADQPEPLEDYADAAPVAATAPAPAQSHSAGYVMLDPDQIGVDAARFQFKAGGDEQGVTDRLRGVRKWNPDLASPIMAWQDTAGKLWVADGHQRTGLAKRAKATGQEGVEVPARVYREEDGYSAEDMRYLAAYRNIAEGTGTPVDAAKIFRAAEASAERAGQSAPELPPASALVRDGKALAKLGDDAFGMVVNDIVPPDYAAHVGNLIADPKQQVAALDVLAKTQPSNSAQARMIVEDVRNAGFENTTQGSLFGDEQVAESLFAERAKVLDYALRDIRGNRGLFKKAISGESALTQAGNKLDTDANQQRLKSDEQLLAQLEAHATRRGPISDALTAAARAVRAGASVRAAAQQFVGAVQQPDAGAASAADARSDDSGRGRPADDGEAQAGQEEVDPNQGGLFGEPTPAAPQPTATRTPPVEKTDQGDQYQLIGQASTAPGKSTATAPQKPADDGLFGAPAAAARDNGQMDIEDAAPAAQANDVKSIVRDLRAAQEDERQAKRRGNSDGELRAFDKMKAAQQRLRDLGQSDLEIAALTEGMSPDRFRESVQGQMKYALDDDNFRIWPGGLPNLYLDPNPDPAKRGLGDAPMRTDSHLDSQPADKPAYGDTNTVFTADAAAKARELLRRKLNGSQLNSGIDPEIIQAGITLAGYHIEAGARSFAAYSKAMVGDLGDVVRPYLRSWYEGVRYDPRAGHLSPDMTPAAEIDRLGEKAGEETAPEADGLNAAGTGSTSEEGNAAENTDGHQSGQQDVRGVGPAGVGEAGTELAEGRPGREEAAGDLGEAPADDAGEAQPSGRGGGTGARPPQPRGTGGAGVSAGRDGADGRSGAGGEGVADAGAGGTGPRGEGSVGQNFAHQAAVDAAGLRLVSGTDKKFTVGLPDYPYANVVLRQGAGGAWSASARGVEASPSGTLEDMLGWAKQTMQAASDRDGVKPAGDAEQPAPVRPNYHIADPEALIGGTPKVRFGRNRAAIEAFRAITEEGRAPTQAELDAMAGYTGWGSFGQELFQGNWATPRPKEGWENEDRWLRDHLGKDEWESAQASIINAHYTDPPTVQAMWGMVRRMGFQGGRVLEPSMGIGNFFGLMPRALMANSDLTGIELDKLTGGMAKLLYPQANVQIKGYETSKTPDGFYDLVIGNWPFAAEGPADRRYDKLNLSLHDYFFVKALDQVRPGGLVVGVTSSFTMDKVGRTARLHLARNAELVAAYRLPTGAFEKYAGTKVVTDIIILKKRAAPLTSVAGESWVDTVKQDAGNGNEITVNQYWTEHPENVLGRMTFGRGTTWGREGMIVERQDDFPQRLAELPGRVPEAVFEPVKRGTEPRFITNNTRDREGAITVAADGKLYAVQGERLAALEDVVKYAVKDAKKTAAREAQIKALVGLRRAYGTLIDAERDGAPDTEDLRKDLRRQYEAFAKAHGAIAESDGLEILRRAEDPFYPTLAALETTDGKPAKILTEPTIRTKRKLDKPTVRDAFVLARNESTTLDLGRVAALSGRGEADVAKELLDSKAIYRTPGGGYEVADIFLSGNVRRKLREALDAKERGEDMDGSIEALRGVLPKDVPYFNIEAKLGATWVSNDDYKQFVADLLGAGPEALGGIEVRFKAGQWKTVLTDRALRSRTETTSGFGTGWYNFDKLVSAAMNNRTVTIKSKDADGNESVNEEATREVNEKAAKIREEFSSWAWRDPERRIKLEHAYNEVMNAIAKPSYDGSFLEFSGMALRRGEDPFSLRSHQANAIWRGVANGAGLYAHEVGTGKTLTMGGIAVESRRYGLARKPLLLAHNANSVSVAREIQEMYPGAKILYVDNLSPDTIDVTMRRIANDDWDAVVVPHSVIDRFALSEQTLMDLASEEIAALEEEAMEAAREDGVTLDTNMMGDDEAMKKVRSATAKQLVHQRNKIIQEIKKQAARASREGAVLFEDLGIDTIIVDEAHEFKKPPLATRMRMRGLNTATSNRSIALRFMTDYVKRLRGGKGVHFFTGTPITNTLTEIYNMMRYVMDGQMAQDGIKDWDAWFNTFADSTNDVELTATGEYEPVSRLAAFVNVAELRRMIGQYMDIVFADDMPEFSPRQTADGKTLASPTLSEADRDVLLNGRTETPVGRPYKKIVTDVGPMGAQQKQVLDTLVEQARHFKNATKKERRELMLRGDPSSPVIVETKAANAGLDVRLYDRTAEDQPDSKANRAVRNVLKHYQEHPKATQVVFLERGFTDSRTRTKTDRDGNKIRTKVEGFNLVADMVDKLVAGGIPREQIAVVDGSTSKEKRKQIADKMNASEIRVVFGNTSTLGVGVNMQRNLRAMHHMDAPWMPGDLEQRNGRGHRQGNTWNTVLEYRYITEKLDGRRWQVLSVKDRFIKSFLKADDTVRVIEGDAVSADEGESADDLAKTLAEAAGDPRILLRNKLQADIERLENRERMHTYGIADAKEKVRQLRQGIKTMQARVAQYGEDAAHLDRVKEANGGFGARIGNKTFTERKGVDDAIATIVRTLAKGERNVTIGTVNGFDLTADWSQSWKDEPEYRLTREGSSAEYLVKPSLASIESVQRNIRKRGADTSEEIETDKASIARLEAMAEQPFAQADTLAKKKAMLADLETDLQHNPVPPPSWLRFGAPVGTAIHVDGTARTVEGHKWTDDDWYVVTPEGDVPYLEAKDANGDRLYEPHPFEAPLRRDDQKAGQPASQTGAQMGDQTDKDLEEAEAPRYRRVDDLIAALEAKPDRAPASVWKRHAELSGVPREELERSGLIDWLAKRRGVVPKAEVLGYLQDADPETVVGRIPTSDDHAEIRYGGGLRGLNRLAPEYVARRATAMAQVKALVKRIAGDALNAEVSDLFLDRNGFGINGAYFDKLVFVSLEEAEDLPPERVFGTVRHEIIHGLRDLKILTGGNWTALLRQAPEWRKAFNIDARYAGDNLSEEMLNEEAVAEAYAKWAADRFTEEKLRPRGPAAAAMQRLKRFFEGVRDILHKLGFRTADSVFRSIESGQMARDDTGRSGANTAPLFRIADLLEKAGAAQAISSAGTSIKQVAALFKSPVFQPKRGGVNLDIGGGKYDLGSDYLAERHGVTNLVFDPFNRSEAHNAAVAERIRTEPADSVTVANVLNVIAEPEARRLVIEQAAANMKPTGTAYFQVYEGDGKGIGRETKAGYQNNRKTADYLDEVRAVFGEAERKGNIIVARQPGGFKPGAKFQRKTEPDSARDDAGPGLTDDLGEGMAAAAQANGTAGQALGAAKRYLGGMLGGKNGAPALPFTDRLGHFARIAAHPRMIAALHKQFVPVWQAATGLMQERDRYTMQMADLAAPYFALTPEQRDRVNKVLELGRLLRQEFSGDTVSVTNDGSTRAALSKRGETIRLSTAETEAYKAVRAAMNRALDLFQLQVLKTFGFGQPNDPYSSEDIMALAQDAESDREKARLEGLAEKIRGIETARRAGYIPFTRYGNMGLVVKGQPGKDGKRETVEYRLIETDFGGKLGAKLGRTLNAERVEEARRELLKKYPASAGYEVSGPIEVTKIQGIIGDGVRLHDLDQLASVAGADPEAYALVREALDKSIKENSFKAHFIQSRDVPGYSTDFERTIADYIYSISGYLARRDFEPQFEDALDKIKVKEHQQDLYDYARTYKDYVMAPQEEWNGLRGLTFFYYLAGNVSSAIVNTSQVPLVTVPYLSQFASLPKVASALGAAYNDVRRMMSWSKDTGLTIDVSKAPAKFRTALQAIEADGLMAAQQTYDMMGLATGQGVIPAALSPLLQRKSREFRRKAGAVADVFTKVFSAAERLNRVVTAIAAMRLAEDATVAQTMDTVLGANPLYQAEVKTANSPQGLEAMGRWAIDETQFRSGKVNRPTMMRGIGAPMMQFKDFQVQMLETLYRMGVQNGPAGRKALATYVGIMLLATGMLGLPFGDDGKDLLEGLYKWATERDLDIEQAVYDMASKMGVPPIAAEIALRGVSRTATGADIGSRMGMGDIVPNVSSPGDLGMPFEMTVGRLGRASEFAKQGRNLEAAGEFLPTFLRNPLLAYLWDQEGVRTRKGNVVIPRDEIGLDDTALKFLGFTSTDVARRREEIYAADRAQRTMQEYRSHLMVRLARERADMIRAQQDGDSSAYAAAQRNYQGIIQEVQQHNRTAAPAERINLGQPSTQSAIKQRVMQELQGADARKAKKQARTRVDEIERSRP